MCLVLRCILALPGLLKFDIQHYSCSFLLKDYLVIFVMAFLESKGWPRVTAYLVVISCSNASMYYYIFWRSERGGEFFKLDTYLGKLEGWLKSISLWVHLGIYWLVEWFEKGFIEVLLMVNLGLSGSICR